MSAINVVAVTPTEGDEHENTTTEGSIHRVTLPANFWSPGKVLCYRASANVNDSNAMDTLTMGLRFGDESTVTDNDALATSNAVDVADNDKSMVDMTLVCRDVGDGTYTVVAMGVISDADASDILVNHAVAVATAFDPSDVTYLDYTADWSAASADDEVACIAAVCYEIA